MKMKKICIAVLLVSMNPAAVMNAFAADEEAIRSAIENQVNQRHPSVPAGFWEGLGSDAIPVIQKMYAESQNANEKTFLIDGLSHFTDTEVGKFLESAVNSTENEVLKKKLLSAVIQSEGEDAFAFVEKYLNDADGHIRTAVARGLLAFNQNEKIKRRLEEFKSSEKTPWVLAEIKRGPIEGLQRTRAQLIANPAKNAGVKPVDQAKVIPPLTEKEWAGVWRGSYITDNKIISLEAKLVLVDATSTPMKWKANFELPKLEKVEWKTAEFTVHYFQTNKAHWIEVRNPKADTVFVAQRKVNKK